jgi:ribonuclease T1
MVSQLLLKVTKMKKLTKLLIPILVLIIAIGLLTSCDICEGDILPTDTPSSINETPVSVDESGSYTSKEDVALYLYTYKRLPNNFITKSEARKLGWNGGSLEEYAPGKCIGGDRFGNYEGLLPEKEGRIFTECDIDTLGKSSRGAKRIVFSNDGLIYYTDDHYESFTLLYGEDNS